MKEFGWENVKGVKVDVEKGVKENMDVDEKKAYGKRKISDNSRASLAIVGDIDASGSFDNKKFEEFANVKVDESKLQNPES